MGAWVDHWLVNVDHGTGAIALLGRRGLAATGQCHLRLGLGHPRHTVFRANTVPECKEGHFGQEHEPVSCLMHFSSALMRQAKPHLGLSVANPNERSSTVGAVPCNRSLHEGAAICPVEVTRSGTDDPRKDRCGRPQIDCCMRQFASLEGKSQEHNCTIRVFDLNCKRHLGPVSSFKRTYPQHNVLRCGGQGRERLRQVPTSTVSDKVIGQDGLNHPDESLAIWWSHDDCGASGSCEAHGTAPMARFIAA